MQNPQKNNSFSTCLGYQQSHENQRVALPQYDKTYANKGRMDMWNYSDSSDSCDDDYAANDSPVYSETDNSESSSGDGGGNSRYGEIDSEGSVTDESVSSEDSL